MLYVYHSQSWVVCDIVIPIVRYVDLAWYIEITMFGIGMVRILHEWIECWEKLRWI